MDRLNYDELYMANAILTSSRGTCNRLKVGALITKNNQIISSGYNGSVAGMPNCQEAGCLIEDGHCIRTIHAELNAILQCTNKFVDISGSTLYSTHFPCIKCMPIIAQVGIKRIVYLYNKHEIQYSNEIIELKEIKIEQLDLDYEKVLNIITNMKGDK